MLVWGGYDGTAYLNTGGRYDLGAPVDHDGDGYSVCQGDCNDSAPSLHPNATDVCNGVDDNCDGQIDEDAQGADSDGDGVPNACDNCVLDENPTQSDFDHNSVGDACDLNDGLIVFSSAYRYGVHWQPEHGFTSWNLYVGDLNVLRATGTYTQDPYSNPLVLRFCGVMLNWVDPVPPPPTGKATFSLVTGVTGGVASSLGTNSAGVPRANANPCP
jgi:hypothetical protein